MNFLKKLAKLILSDFLISKISGIFYGWHGNYSSWEIARSKCTGYDETQILDKVFETSLKVKNGIIPFERDSVPFNKTEYSFPVLAALMWISGQNKNKLNVIDFGGSLGTSYYQNLFFLNTIQEVNWCIVEQAHFVKKGIDDFADNNLHFFNSIKHCTDKYEINTILISCVLQYVEKPYELLEEIISKDFDNIIFDRTLFSGSDKDRLTVQKVPEKIYKAKYCCWFLSEKRFLDLFSQKYELIYDFSIDENINIRSLYKGYFFKRKNLTTQ